MARFANRLGAALLGAALLTLIFVVVVFTREADKYAVLAAEASRLDETIDTANATLSALKDGETGQRGYLISGRPEFLEPYNNGLRDYETSTARLRQITAPFPLLAGKATEMEGLGREKLVELAYLMQIYREDSPEEAADRLREGRGKRYMDDFRKTEADLVHRLQAEQRRNADEMGRLEQSSRVSAITAAGLLFLFTAGGSLLLAVEIRNERRIAADLAASERRLKALAATLEQKVEDRTKHLEQLNSELTAFSYSVSHDLRAPLRSIDGFSQIVLEDYGDKLDDTGRNLLQRVRTASKRMGELIASLLELSRVTRWELKRQPASISEIASSVLGTLAANEPEREVETAVAPGLTANGDPQLLRIVLENLLSNAWKFTAKTEDARIEVGQKVVNGRTAFFVADNGSGFDAGKSDRLFTPFQRFHSEAEFSGTGIGLATVQRIISRHDGEVWATSRKGEGATFFFRV